MEFSYYIFPNEELASKTLSQINMIMGFKKGLPSANWCDIETHPKTSECLLLYDSRIEKCQYLFKDYSKISLSRAIELGWYFGFHKGRYARLIAKLEEANILFHEIKSNYGVSFFTVQKALLLSFTYSCYSIKETISYLSNYRNKSNKIKNPKSSDEQQAWWRDKWDNEINSKGELLQYVNNLHNSDKHSTSLYVQAKAVYHMTRLGGKNILCRGNQFLEGEGGRIYMGSEGFFEVDKTGNFPMRRPVSDQSKLMSALSISKADYEIELVDVPNLHLGKKIYPNSTIDYLRLVHEYYVSLVNEVVTKFP